MWKQILINKLPAVSRRIVFLDELRIGELYFRKSLVFQETKPRLISL